MNVVDMHCDTISELYEKRQQGEQFFLRKNPLHIDLMRMTKGEYLLQNFALFVHMKRELHPFEYAMKLVDQFYLEMEANADLIGVVTSWNDIEVNQKKGRMSALLALEEGAVCEGEIGFLRNFYRLGVRMMTLTWNFKNQLAYPNRWENPKYGRFVPELEHGLTETGIAFVEEMERLGMIIDVSHLGDAGIWEVFRHTKKPFVASHSNARSIAGHPRNLTDEMIRALAERGGVAGINFSASFLKDEEDGKEPIHSNLNDMVLHIKHMKKIAGIECIGLGSDFDGIESMLEMKECSGIQMLADEMARQGFTTGEIERVFSGNVLRVYRELLH